MTTPKLSDDAIKRIKESVYYHYGFTAVDRDIFLIDEGLRGHYIILHEQHIIQELVTQEVSKDLLIYRDKIGSLEYERIWFEKSIFKYLTLASMCYRAGISAGAISLCRTAIDAGLRERLAEHLAARDAATEADLPIKTLESMRQLQDKSLADLIREASKEKILNESDIEEEFSSLKFQKQSSRKCQVPILYTNDK